MRQARPLDLGWDVHQDAMAVASVAQEHGAEVLDLGAIGTRPCDIEQLIRKMPSKATPLVFVDEAGPCGDGRYRDLTTQGSVCWVVAPALIPNKAGARVPTDRRDAKPWARLLRAGDLTPVSGPAGADEAMRHLSRARDEAWRALKTATCRLKAVLRRPDSRSTGQATGGPAHWRWRAAVVCPTPAQQMVGQASVRTVTAHTACLQRLEHALQEPGQTWRMRPVVEAWQALRGVPFLVAVTVPASRIPASSCVTWVSPLQRLRVASVAGRAPSRRRGTCMPVAPSATAPGPLAPRPPSAAIGRAAWNSAPRPCRTSAGRRRCAWVSATAQ